MNTHTAPTQGHLQQSLASAATNALAKHRAQSGTWPTQARASFRVRLDGESVEYVAILKRVGGAA